ncbi:MAG: hypothetical protein PHO26_02505 [Dehalococcoidia bacterium]|nr:hypothetical protein [Dehalococcoidia bacterium]MDD5494155.1 hypothetical protein [Dehalococcoidia bacterium]
MDKSVYRLFNVPVFTLLILTGIVFAGCKADTATPVNTSPPTSDSPVTQESAEKQKSDGMVQPSPGSQPEVWRELNLRYDNLGSGPDEYLYNQIAIGHSYVYVWQEDISTDYNVIKKADKMALAGPLIILPSIVGYGARGMFAIAKDYAGQYRLEMLEFTSRDEPVDDLASLDQPGWGLMTTFTPEKVPYRIQKINLCGVANYTTGPLSDYDSYHVLVKILDKNGGQIWKKMFSWSDFRNTETRSIVPAAMWKEIAVNGVTVTDGFSVEVSSENDEYISYGQDIPRARYFALGYEKITDKGNINTQSSISENGRRAQDFIRIYDPKGDPVGFNLCIRVEGSYLEK